MRILMITDGMGIGGAETHVITLIEELTRMGEKITLISGGGAYADRLSENGINCITAPLTKRDAKSIIISLGIIKSSLSECDVVHTHTRLSSYLAKRARGNRTYPPIVTTAHLNFPLFPFGPITFWGEHTLAVSEDIKEGLEESWGVDPSRITVTKNAINTADFQKNDNREKIIMHTSRIDGGRAKCAFLLVNAGEKILPLFPLWRIVIVGDGNKFSSLRRAAIKVNKRLGYDGIILKGARSDIPNLIANSSIFVGVSRSALEGMAAGIATVLCGDEGYGGIVSKDNFDIFSKTNFCARGLEGASEAKLIRDLRYLIESPEERRALGDCLQRRIEADFHPSMMATDAHRCYLRVAKRPRLCLVGYFGYSNLGDEETLREAISIISNLGISDISVLYRRCAHYPMFSENVKFYDRNNIKEIKSAIIRNDTVVFCGGNLLQNETSLRSLLYYTFIIKYAKAMKKRIIMLSSGFGAINGAIAGRILDSDIRDCDFCGCRTSEDLKRAKGLAQRCALMPDLCFLLPEEVCERRNRKFVWIVSSRGAIGTDEVLKIAKERSLTPIALILNPEDTEVSEEITRRGIKCVTAYGYEEFKGTVPGVRFVISERLHGGVLSLICHVPVYLTTDSEKNRALTDEIAIRCKELNVRDILFGYDEALIIQKKEIGVKNSDFQKVLLSIKRDIESSIKELF